MSDWTSLRYVVVDVEGNGQQPPDLVELAVVPIAGGVVGEPASWLVQPAMPITHLATRIHGIRNADVDESPAFTQIADQVRQALDVDVLVAHNAHVDVGVLQRKLGEWECPEVFDTLKLARRLLPELDSYKLGNVVNALSLAEGLPSDLKPHRATYDALVCARLFIRIARRHALAELRDQPAKGRSDETATLFEP
jgi:exodeoxyribonuclease X